MANIRCFILIAVKKIIISYVNSLEEGNTSLFDSLVSSKISISTRPDGELIRESVCLCANLLNCLLIEEHVLKSNRGSTKKVEGFYTKTTEKGGLRKLCVKNKKTCYTDLLHFSTRIR